MAWKPKPKKWNWRRFLTEEEHHQLAMAEAAKARWQELNQGRAKIVNRAIQRAKFEK